MAFGHIGPLPSLHTAGQGGPGSQDDPPPPDDGQSPAPRPGPADDRRSAIDPRDHGRLAAAEKIDSPRMRALKRGLDCVQPWDLAEIDTSTETDAIMFWLVETAGYWPCPICGMQSPAVGRTRPQVFRCLPCQPPTRVAVRIPIAHCPEHGRQQVVVPWATRKTKWVLERALSGG